MVRTATHADIPAILDMGADFHAASQLPFTFNRDVMGNMLAAMIDNDVATVLMTDRGIIGGMLNPAYCNPEWVYAVEIFWWAHGDGLALLRAFERWAHDAGAEEVRMTSLATLPRADRLLRFIGYSPAEISYSKVL